MREHDRLRRTAPLQSRRPPALRPVGPTRGGVVSHGISTYLKPSIAAEPTPLRALRRLGAARARHRIGLPEGEASPVPGGVARDRAVSHETAPSARQLGGFPHGGQVAGLAVIFSGGPLLQACDASLGQPVIASNFHRLEPIVPLRSRRTAKAIRAI